MEKEKVGELWHVLIKPEFENWKIERPDKGVEDFSSFRLLESLLESEIDIESALRLIDRIVERIRNIISHGTLTHLRIARAVADTIARDDSPDAKYWKQNYLAIFGPARNDEGPPKNYINVRHKEQLKGHILSYLCELCGVENEKKVKALLGESEFSKLTDRLLKLIRFCGFYDVRRDFLNLFLEELAENSHKAIIPTRKVDKDAAVKAILDAERSILLASDEAGSNYALAKNAIYAALENVGSVALRTYGLLPRRNSMGSFRRFVDLVQVVAEDGNGARATFPDLQEISRGLMDDIRSQGLPIKKLIEDSEDLLSALDDGHVLRACRLASATIPLVRLLVSRDSWLANIITCDLAAEGEAKYAQLCLAYFQEKQFTACRVPKADAVDLDIDFGYHELLDLGRVFRIRFVHHEEEWDSNAPWIRSILDDCIGNEEIIPVVVSDAPAQGDAIELARSNLREIKRCAAIIDKNVFEGALHRVTTLRDVVQRSLVPRELPWRSQVFQKKSDAALAPSIIGGVRKALTRIHLHILQDFGAGACREAGVLLENSIREHMLFIYTYRKHARKHAGISPNLRIESGKWNGRKFSGLGAYVNWMSDSKKDCQGKKGGAAYIRVHMDDDISQEVRALAKLRNHLSHRYREVDAVSARAYVDKVSSVVANLYHLKRGFKRGVAIRTNKDSVIFCEDSSMVDALEKDTRRGESIQNGDCVYVEMEDGNEHGYIFPAVSICEECGEIVYMQTGYRKKYKCPRCSQRIFSNEPWESLVSSARVRWRAIESEADRGEGGVQPSESMSPNFKRPAGIEEQVGIESVKHVFISYSHKDKDFHDDLLVVLKPYLLDDAISAWSDDQIASGSKWMDEIRSALTSAKVALLLVSKHFLASDFIRNEELGPLLKEAESGGVRILWVRIGACGHLESPLKDFQAVVSPPGPPLATLSAAERDEAWVRVCDAVKLAMTE